MDALNHLLEQPVRFWVFLTEDNRRNLRGWIRHVNLPAKVKWQNINVFKTNKIQSNCSDIDKHKEKFQWEVLGDEVVWKVNEYMEKWKGYGS